MSPIILVLAFLISVSTDVHADMGMVTTVLDADTVDVAVSGTLVRLRLAGIGAPEAHSLVPCAKALGQAAKGRVIQLLLGETVRYESRGFDKYKRIIAMVYLGDIWISELLVREGLARRVASYPVAKVDRAKLIAAEAEAKAAHRGLWGP